MGIHIVWTSIAYLSTIASLVFRLVHFNYITGCSILFAFDIIESLYSIISTLSNSLKQYETQPSTNLLRIKMFPYEIYPFNFNYNSKYIFKTSSVNIVPNRFL